MSYRAEYALLSDEDLVRLFQTGVQNGSAAEKNGAFTVIVERYQRKLYYAARKMMDGNHDEADEVTQETFVKAFDALASFRSEAKLYTWLYRIMMNATIQKSRKRKLRPQVDVNEMSDRLDDGNPDPGAQMVNSETTRIIEQAIETLPPKQKEVFLMRFYDEMPYEDIAEVLGTSVGGLKANYFHAVKKIGEYLHQSGKISMEAISSLSKA